MFWKFYLRHIAKRLEIKEIKFYIKFSSFQTFKRFEFNGFLFWFLKAIEIESMKGFNKQKLENNFKLFLSW